MGSVGMAEGIDHGQHKDAGCWSIVLNRAGRPSSIRSRIERIRELMFNFYRIGQFNEKALT